MPPASLQAAEMPAVSSGVSLEVVSGWGGDAAAQLPPPFLSPGRMSSPQGHPDGVLAGSDQSVEPIGEVRGSGGVQVGVPFPPRPFGLSRTHSCLALLFSGCVQRQGGVCSDSALVSPRSQARTGRSWLCALGTVTGLRKVGESPSHIPAGSP